MKVLPPFPKLPSLLASAIILSYFNGKDIVGALMNLLSKKTAQYLVGHNTILKDFLLDTHTISGILTCGIKEEEIDCGYPTPSQSHFTLPRGTHPKLSMIRF